MPIFMETKRLENLKTPGAVDPTETFGFAYSLPPCAKCFEDQRTSGYWHSLAGHLFAKLARWKSCSPQSVVVLAARGFNWNWKQLMVCQSSSLTSSCALYGSSTAKITRKPCKGRCFIPPKTWRNEELKDSESCSAIQILGKLFCLCVELLYTRLMDSHKIYVFGFFWYLFWGRKVLESEICYCSGNSLNSKVSKVP